MIVVDALAVNAAPGKGCLGSVELSCNSLTSFAPSADFSQNSLEVSIFLLGVLVVDDEVLLEGNSVRADLMTESYANQLESIGLWQWSIFILLHLELPSA